MKKILLFLFLAFVACANFSYSHEEETSYNLDPTDIYPLKPWTVVGYGSLVFAFLVVVILMSHKKMSELIKKTAYFLVVASVSFVTLYIIITTLHLNIISVAKGPVHWHADFEIWICDDEINPIDTVGFSNKIGTPLLHEHNDNRIHVEGVVLNKRDVSLGAFFYALGGSLVDDGIKVPTNNGFAEAHDGDQCNNQEAKLYVFVNGRLIEEPASYVLAPYERIPPGDTIKIVFTEKPFEEINPYIKTMSKSDIG